MRLLVVQVKEGNPLQGLLESLMADLTATADSGTLLSVLSTMFSTELQDASGLEWIEQFKAMLDLAGQDLGEGKKLRRMITELGLEDRVLLTGAVDRKSLLALEHAKKAESEAVVAARLSEEEELSKARAVHREGESSRRLAELEYERSRELKSSGLLPLAELERARAELDRCTASLDAAERELSRLEFQHRQMRRERERGMWEAERELATVVGEIQEAAAALDLAQAELEQRVIRSPIAGRLGDVVGTINRLKLIGTGPWHHDIRLQNNPAATMTVTIT